MTLIRRLLSLAVLAWSTSALSQSQEIVIDPTQKIEGGAGPISHEEAICRLLRQRTTETTEICEPRFAKQVGLDLNKCSVLTKTSTIACDAYSRSLVEHPVRFAQCLKTLDSLRKCTTVISAGCEYTKALASKLESVEGLKDVEFAVSAIRSECPLPNVGAMAARAQTGSLRVLAFPE